jgi:hypothetical protein
MRSNHAAERSDARWRLQTSGGIGVMTDGPRNPLPKRTIAKMTYDPNRFRPGVAYLERLGRERAARGEVVRDTVEAIRIHREAERKAEQQKDAAA